MKVESTVAVTSLALMITSTTLLPPAGASVQRVARSAPAARTPTHVRARPQGAAARLFGGPGTWTKLSNGTGGGLNEVGLLRTSDGKLHVVWVKENAPSDWTLGYNTISLSGTLLKTGVVLAHWDAFQLTPRLVPDGKQIRLVFNGTQNTTPGNKFAVGARYTATSSNGSTWTLASGSLSSRNNFNSALAATAETNGTPVSSEGLNATLYYHVGIDSAVPSTTADKPIVAPPGGELQSATLIRDHSGAIWMGWWQLFGAQQGYHVEKILPTKATAIKAPSSGNPNWDDNEPHQAVALAARTSGGVYLAYCEESKTANCARVVLWKVGSKTAKTVPGSTGVSAGQVTLSASPGGRLVVGWYNSAKNVIDVVRTNTAATAFGPLRTVKVPSKTLTIDGLFSESSSGRIDLVANVLQTTSGNPIAFWHTQVLAGLKVTASPTKVSHASAHTVTFTVTDAGQAVASATVRFLGKSKKTNSHGKVSFTVPKGEAKGSHSAQASKTNYYRAVVSVKVT